MSRGMIFVGVTVLIVGSVLFAGFLIPLDSELLEVVVVKSWSNENQESLERNYEAVYDNQTVTFVWKELKHTWTSYAGDRLRLRYNVYLFGKRLTDVQLVLTHQERLSSITHTVFREGRTVEVTYEDPLNETVFVYFEIRDYYDYDTIVWEFSRNDSNFMTTWNVPNRYLNYFYILQFKLKYESKQLEQRGILYGEFA